MIGALDRRGAGASATFVLVASVAFATSGPFARAAAPAHPLAIALGRVALASLLLAVTDLRGLSTAVSCLSLRQFVGVLGAGAILAAHFALFTWGIQTTSLPAALTLVSLEPLAVVAAAFVFHGVRPRRLEALGVGLATVGALLVSRGAGSGEHRLFGDLLVLGSVALYGLYIAFARGLRDAVPARHYPTLVYATSAFALGLAVLALPERVSILTSAAAPGPATFIALLAVVPTLVGHSLVQNAARHLSPSVVSLVSPGETLFGLAIAAVWFSAIPQPVELAGALVILAGVGAALVAQSRPS